MDSHRGVSAETDFAEPECGNSNWPSDGLQAAVHLAAHAGRQVFRALDVGAHEGESLRVIQSHAPRPASYIGMEPNRRSHEVLRGLASNLAMPDFIIELRAEAAAKKSEQATFRATRASAVSGILSAPEELLRRVPQGDHERAESYLVSTVPLDKLCQEVGWEEYVSVLKVDTEGYELEVLSGMSEMLRRGAVDVILSEVFFVQYRVGQCYAWDVGRFLHDQEYRFVNFYDCRLTHQGRLYTGNMLWVSQELSRSLDYF